MNTILSINASLHVRGGADRFFTELNRLMLDKGERVVTFTCASESSTDMTSLNTARYFTDNKIYPEGVLEKIAAVSGVFYSPGIIRILEKVLEKERPVIVHIHNIYHRIPYGIIDVLGKYGVRSVWWLHDYKWICPNHQLFTEGALCKRCVDGRYIQAIRHRCQLESFHKSVIASAFAYFVAKHGWRDKIDRFIAPSRCVCDLFKEFGFPADKISVLPHFNYCGDTVAGTGEGATVVSGKPYALYVGRIEKNKGLYHCVQAFGKSGLPLKIVGTGNYETELKRICNAGRFSPIEFTGHVAPDKLSVYFRNALFVVVPSVWYEVFGLAVLESFNYGKPVVAADIGALPEVVEDRRNGLLYHSGNAEELCDKIKWMFDNPDAAGQMGQYARGYVARHFSAESYWERLQSVHASLVRC